MTSSEPYQGREDTSVDPILPMEWNTPSSSTLSAPCACALSTLSAQASLV